MCLIFLSLALFLQCIVGNSDDLDFESKTEILLRRGLSSLGSLDLHLFQPTHQHITSLENEFQAQVVRHSLSLLRILENDGEEQISKKNGLLEQFLEQLQLTEEIHEVKPLIRQFIDQMVENLSEGVGNIDSILDDVTRLELEDFYHFFKHMVLEETVLQEMKSNVSTLETDQPTLKSLQNLSNRLTLHEVRALSDAVLGTPSLMNMFVRPWIIKVAKRQLRIEISDEDLEILINLGQFFNDVLKRGFLSIRPSLMEARSRASEVVSKGRLDLIAKAEECRKVVRTKMEEEFLLEKFLQILQSFSAKF